VNTAHRDQPAAPPAVRLAGIVKRFGDLLANDAVDFTLRRGEIHALLGENGAGKSTLMNILAGVYTPDAGVIELAGRPVRFRTPREAIRAGVGMVHQHFAQVPSCTAAQNLALADPRGAFFLDRGAMHQKILALGYRFGLLLPPDVPAGELSVGEQQRLELLRLLAFDAQVLILDEPTAVLTPGETKDLFITLRRLAAGGKAIVFITHKLDEVEAVADCLTVLRRGRVAASRWRVADHSREEVVACMVGGASPVPAAGAAAHPGETVLALRDVQTSKAAARERALAVSLEVRAGEIVAVAGVAGNGQRELAEVLIGLRPITAGTRWLSGQNATRWSAPQVRRAGIGYVPEDRLAWGVCAGRSLAENLILAQWNQPGPFFPTTKDVLARAERLAASMNVAYSDLREPIRSLSGGNIQRAVLAREIAAATRLLVVAQPTRGLDVAATAAVRHTLRERRGAGVAVLLISYDLDEILELADRVVVMARGRIVAEFARPLPDRTAIGLAMTGGAAHAS
jgi:simple sugar transport system ATP-binding protein